jgi:SAM-dependent methyltransferase
MPARYTHGHHDSVLRSHRWRTAENSSGYLLPHLRPGHRLLDVGSGPGTITVDLAARIAPGRVTALETSAEVLELTRATAERVGADLVLTVGDVHELPFEDDTFNVVHAHQVLQHVADPVLALREMHRVCRPGGLVAARDADYAAFTWHPSSEALDRWMQLYQKVARGNGGEPDAGRRLLAWAREAGLTDVTPGASTWCFATPEDLDYWCGMWADRVVDSALATQALEQGLATAPELRELQAAFRVLQAADGAWFTVLHGEILARV